MFIYSCCKQGGMKQKVTLAIIKIILMFRYLLLLLQKLFFPLITERVTTDFCSISIGLHWIPLEKNWLFFSLAPSNDCTFFFSNHLGAAPVVCFVLMLSEEAMSWRNVKLLNL